MAQEKLDLVRINDHEGSHWVWQTEDETRQQRWNAFSQWCSDTSLMGVAAVASVWKWARRSNATSHLKLANATPSRAPARAMHMRFDAQA